MSPSKIASDYKWLELQIKTLATTAAGISGELSAHKKDYYALSDRVLIIETQRDTEKERLGELCASIDGIETEREKELKELKEDLEKEIKEVKDSLALFKSKFTPAKLLGYASVSLGIAFTIIKMYAWIIKAHGTAPGIG